MGRISIRQKVLERNEELAARLREKFNELGILALNLIGTPGAGKTSLLEKTLQSLDGVRMGVIAGDVQTRNDADRLLRFGSPVVDIRTEGACHLDAAMVDRATAGLPLEEIDLLFIENVGNLVCPASYDLGEAMKVTVISVTEGDDKPEKYPSMFARSGAMVINKTDLLPYTDFDLAAAAGHARRLNPELRIFNLSCRSGEGVDDWVKFVETELDRVKAGKKA